MVPLVCVASEFAGRVLVAKLGSAGIIAELRGVSRVYPAVLGAPQVWVEATELAEARELITAETDDELAADARAGVGPDGAAVTPRSLVRPVLVAVAIVVLASVSFGPRACSPPGNPTSVGAH